MFIEYAAQGPATGTSGHKVPYLDAVNTWSGQQYFYLLAMQSDDPGATMSPFFDIYRNSASPASGDQMGVMRFVGRNSTPAIVVYSQIYGVIDDPTAGSEDAHISFGTASGGVVANRLHIGAGIYTQGVIDKGIDPTNTIPD